VIKIVARGVVTVMPGRSDDLAAWFDLLRTIGAFLILASAGNLAIRLIAA